MISSACYFVLAAETALDASRSTGFAAPSPPGIIIRDSASVPLNAMSKPRMATQRLQIPQWTNFSTIHFVIHLHRYGGHLSEVMCADSKNAKEWVFAGWQIRVNLINAYIRLFFGFTVKTSDKYFFGYLNSKRQKCTSSLYVPDFYHVSTLNTHIFS